MKRILCDGCPAQDVLLGAIKSYQVGLLHNGRLQHAVDRDLCVACRERVVRRLREVARPEVESDKPDPRIAAVIRHFSDLRRSRPDALEIAALLQVIDAARPDAGRCE